MNLWLISLCELQEKMGYFAGYVSIVMENVWRYYSYSLQCSGLFNASQQITLPDTVPITFGLRA